MKTTLKSLLLISLLATGLLASASNIINFADSNGLVTTFNATTVGTSDPNTGNCIPFLCNTSGQVANVDYQQVYAGASVGAQTITSIDFYNNINFGGSTLVIGGTYSVYLSSTSAAVNGLNSANMASNRGADWTLVGSFSAGTNTNPMITISVNPFNFDPANGNLLFEILGTGQANVCNGCGNSYMEVDPSGAVTSRAVSYDTTTNTPEPGTLVMLGSGILGLAGVLRRKLA
jgi:hypothetical protein